MSDKDRSLCVLVVEERPDERSRILAQVPPHYGIEVRFAASGHQALAHLEFHGGIDVLVTRSSTSRSEGLHLLGEARIKAPSVARVLVLGDDDLGDSANQLSHAHEVLRGPLKVDTLFSFVLRQDSLRHHNGDVVALVGAVDTLPSPPRHISMLNEAVASPEISIEEVATALERDAAATAKLLGLVNSAYFGLPHRVKSVHHALAYLGLETTRNVLAALELISASSQVPPELRSFVQLAHSHSMTVATHSRRLAQGTHYVHDAFAAGLMHDIGILVLLARQPDKFRELCNSPENELEILGATHAHIGAALLGSWGLPWTIIDAVACSHDADTRLDPIPNASHAVFVAEQVTAIIDGNAMPWELTRMPADEYLESVRSRESVLELVGQHTSR